MRVVVASPNRLQREAIRRSLLRSAHEADLYAPTLEALRAALRTQPAQLALLSASFDALTDAANELSSHGVAVAVLAEAAEVDAAYRAMIGSSAAVITPPTIDESGELHGAQRFIAQIERLQRTWKEPAAPRPSRSGSSAASVPLIAIGASTGGPAALKRLLAALPRPLGAAVLVVQHIDAEYTLGFGDWLQGESNLPVRVVAGGERVQAGTIYLAPPDFHLVMAGNGLLELQRGAPGDSHVPAVEPLFRSLAAHGRRGYAVLLTGMGEDGAGGLRALRDSGWQTYAQDAASAVVHGMPGAAIALGGADQVLEPAAIGAHIGRLLSRGA
jgi:chemotaxis response regulator CheB